MKVTVQQEKRKLIRRMNEEMEAIANSPTSQVEKFRLGLLAKFAGELKTLNDRVQWKSHQARDVS